MSNTHGFGQMALAQAVDKKNIRTNGQVCRLDKRTEMTHIQEDRNGISTRGQKCKKGQKRQKRQEGTNNKRTNIQRRK